VAAAVEADSPVVHGPAVSDPTVSGPTANRARLLRVPVASGARAAVMVAAPSRPTRSIAGWSCASIVPAARCWEQLADEGKPQSRRTAEHVRPETPITDGERVYAYFGMRGLYCYDLAGKPLWNKQIGSFPMTNGWGTGSSPALDDERLFVQCDNEQESFLAAFDKRTGKELWRVPREERSNWSTPYVWRNSRRIELVTAGGGKMRGYDPSNGKLLWELSGVNGRCSATPVAANCHVGVAVVVPTAGGDRAGAEGEFDLKNDNAKAIAWVDRAGPPPPAAGISDCIYVSIVAAASSAATTPPAARNTTASVSREPRALRRRPGATTARSIAWTKTGRRSCWRPVRSITSWPRTSSTINSGRASPWPAITCCCGA
jgi:hypothetical protein